MVRSAVTTVVGSSSSTFFLSMASSFSQSKYFAAAKAEHLILQQGILPNSNSGAGLDRENT